MYKVPFREGIFCWLENVPEDIFLHIIISDISCVFVSWHARRWTLSAGGPAIFETRTHSGPTTDLSRDYQQEILAMRRCSCTFSFQSACAIYQVPKKHTASLVLLLIIDYVLENFKLRSKYFKQQLKAFDNNSNLCFT